MTVYLLNGVEKIMANGEIAHHDCFQKASAAEASESVYMWERELTCLQNKTYNTVTLFSPISGVFPPLGTFEADDSNNYNGNGNR